jgi:hypothetical protein
VRDDLISAGRREVEKSSKLREAVARQISSGETILHQQEDGGEHIAVTDRRLVITRVGNWLGERSESVPLGAISGFSTHMKDGKVATLQIAVPGRSMGELGLSGEDLSRVLAALVLAMPSYGASRGLSQGGAS